LKAPNPTNLNTLPRYPA